MNVLSKIIVELIRCQRDGSVGKITDGSIPVYHAVNPTSSSWPDLLPTVSPFLGQSVKIVDWSTWLAALQGSQETTDPAGNPAIKLLDFYEQAGNKAEMGLALPRLETKIATQHSKTLREVEKVGSIWMETWMRQWNF